MELEGLTEKQKIELITRAIMKTVASPTFTDMTDEERTGGKIVAIFPHILQGYEGWRQEFLISK